MTNRNRSETETGGRPTSYDVNLVHKIVSTGLTAGIPASDLDANYVLKELSSKHGVSPKIRKESLQAHVDAAHEEIQEATNKALLKALPPNIAAAVDEAVAAVGREFLLLVARQHAASVTIADQACEELRVDKRNAKHRIKPRVKLRENEAHLATAPQHHIPPIRVARFHQRRRVGLGADHLGVMPSGNLLHRTGRIHRHHNR